MCARVLILHISLVSPLCFSLSALPNHSSVHTALPAQGFCHGFVACLVPFVAEECGAELFAVVAARRARRGGRADFAAEGAPYAYRPTSWVLYVDAVKHVK